MLCKCVTLPRSVMRKPPKSTIYLLLMCMSIICLISKTLFCFPPFHSVDSVEAAFAMEPEAFKAKYGVTKPPLEAPELVFHCQMGRRGAMATNTAYKLGYVK